MRIIIMKKLVEDCVFKKDMELELFIEDMGIEGEGIGRVESTIFFVKDAVLGDQVRVKIMKMKKNYGYARLLEILKPSIYRVEPYCRYYRQCGGCQIQVLDYQKQLNFKENKVRNNLKRIGGFSLISSINPIETEEPSDKQKSISFINPIIGMEEPYYYRNKAQFPVGTDSNGKIVTGFYAARTHNIISNQKCFLGVDINEKILDIVIAFMEKYQISSYNETTRKGLIRHILIRFGFSTKEIMVCLVINGKYLPYKEELIKKLQVLEGMTSIVLNINEKNTNVILGEKIINLWGQNFITDYIGNVKYQISPLSFYQVNPIQTKKMYEIVLEYAGLTGKEIVWDLYCGIGTISLFLAQKAKRVYGVEVVDLAIEDARNNAKINGIENVEFFVGKVEEVLPTFYENITLKDIKIVEQIGIQKISNKNTEKKEKIVKEQVQVNDILYPDVIVVDPPRKGCDEKCLETIVKMKPHRVVYVSCDSATLARDLKYLCEREYKISEVQPVDMFPHTVHVECVVKLCRKI